MITLLNINGFSPNLLCALILWTSALGLLMLEFRLFWQSYLPAKHPYFTFRTITWINFSGFSPNLMCALILWRSALGPLIGKFHQFWQSYLPTTQWLGIIVSHFIFYLFLHENICCRSRVSLTFWHLVPQGKVDMWFCMFPGWNLYKFIKSSRGKLSE